MMILKLIKKWLMSVLLVSPLLFCQSLYAGSILIWPIDPVIEDERNATALWLENRDIEPAYLQIRVLQWQQIDGEDRYSKQSNIIVSPPFVEIGVGKRQLIRLVKSSTVPVGKEVAYRILVDETPRENAESLKKIKAPGVGLTFQMRYSVPLFVSGAGVWTKQDFSHPRNIEKATQPKLSYRLLNKNGQQFIQLKNEGAVHARMSQVTHNKKVLSEGLFGYVLSGASMSFPLPGNIGSNAKLEVLVNSNPNPMVLNRY